MDYKFLDKVVDQIVSETRIDYDMEEIQFPFPPLFSFCSPHLSFLSPLLSLPSSFFHSARSILFSKHCRDVYGLNEEETMYVWEEYIQIIKDKIDNNGL